MIKLYVATISNINVVYAGIDKDMRRKFFKGLAGYWVVWDKGVMNSPRLVLDDMDKPKGFTPFMFKDGTVQGYEMDTIII